MAAKEVMHTFTIQVPQSTLDNFTKIVEEGTGFKILDPVKYLQFELDNEVEGGLESIAYAIADGDSLHESQDCPELAGVVDFSEKDDEGEE
jgi:hypothetical protein